MPGALAAALGYRPARCLGRVGRSRTRGTALRTHATLTRTADGWAMRANDLNWQKRRYNALGAYCDSKLDDLLFTFELQRRLTAAGSTVRSIAAHPGIAATNLTSHACGLTALISKMTFLPNTAEHGALPPLYAATQDVPAGPYGIDARAHDVGLPVSVARRSSNSGAPGWNAPTTAQGGVGSQGRRLAGERTAEGCAEPVPLVGSRDMDVQVDTNAQDQLGDEHPADAQAGHAQPGEPARAPVRVWLLRCPLPGDALAGRWFSVLHGRTASSACSGEQVADRGGEDADRVVLGDLAGPDLVSAGVHERDARGHQPPGGPVGPERPVGLPSLQQRADALVRGLVGPRDSLVAEELGHRGGHRLVPRQVLPGRGEHPVQRLGGRSVIGMHGLQGCHRPAHGTLDGRLRQRFPGRKVRVDGDPGYPGLRGHRGDVRVP